MALEMNAIVNVKSVARPLEKDASIYHFEGEMNGYNPEIKKEETVSNSDLTDNSLIIH
jgi:hypothetical protein